MKQTFTLEGLDCANCAGKIEAAVRQLPEVHSAQLNFLKQTLVLEAHTDMSRQVQRIVHQLEPEVKVLTSHDQTAKQKPEVLPWLRLGMGAVLLVVGLLTPLRLPLLLGAYALLGWDVIWKAVRNLFRGQLLDENFLMTLSTVCALAIGELPEAAAVMLLYQLGEGFQELAVQRSRGSISALMELRADSARVLRKGQYLTVSPETVAVGEQLQLRPGERLPLDGIVLEGSSTLDTSALTGESMPRSVQPGDPVLSGCINGQGTLTVQVTKPYGESTAARILELVENAAARKAPAESFITAFARYYTPIVVLLAALLALVPPLFLGNWSQWLHRSCVFLVVSCPGALVISIPLAFFGGIGAASRHGILIKGGNYLQALTKVDTLALDKTGTLTEGSFRVDQVLCAPGVSREQVLTLAARAESLSTHPIARSILAECPAGLTPEEAQTCREHPGKGVSVTAAGQHLAVGSASFLEEQGIPFPPCPEPGTKVYVAADGGFMGCILIRDRCKADSKAAIAAWKELGIRHRVMLTGDEAATAEAVAQELGLDQWYAGLLPGEKVEKLEQLDREKRPGTKLAFVGDGVNDAPVLARADIGIAMGGLGSDAAIEAADVVLMSDAPSQLTDAIQIAKATRRIVIGNIIFALSVKGICLLLGALGVAGMWEAVFADVGVSLLAILNAMRLLRMNPRSADR